MGESDQEWVRFRPRRGIGFDSSEFLVPAGSSLAARAFVPSRVSLHKLVGSSANATPKSPSQAFTQI